MIPGMGPEDKIEVEEEESEDNIKSEQRDKGGIPGLDLDLEGFDKREREKKVPYSKPIPRNFQAQWNDTVRQDDNEDTSKEIKEVITQIVENTPNIIMPLPKIAPSAIVVYGKLIRVFRKFFFYYLSNFYSEV